MNNAGAKTNFDHYITKKLFLDEKLMPVEVEKNSSGLIKILFFYENKEESQKLVKISFSSNDDIFKDFEIGEKLINRFISFNRSDDKAMELLRKNSLENKSLPSLKRYAFECIKYI